MQAFPSLSNAYCWTCHSSLVPDSDQSEQTAGFRPEQLLRYPPPPPLQTCLLYVFACFARHCNCARGDEKINLTLSDASSCFHVLPTIEMTSRLAFPGLAAFKAWYLSAKNRLYALGGLFRFCVKNRSLLNNRETAKKGI